MSVEGHSTTFRKPDWLLKLFKSQTLHSSLKLSDLIKANPDICKYCSDIYVPENNGLQILNSQQH